MSKPFFTAEDFSGLGLDAQICADRANAKTAELVDALKFYADKSSWPKGMYEFGVTRRIHASDLDEVEGHSKYCGGARARLVLYQLKIK